MNNLPGHLRLETYYLNEIRDLKDHILGMLELALPESDRTARNEDWEQLLYSPDGQFGVLFGSLELIREKVGDETCEHLRLMSHHLKSTYDAADWQRYADLVHKLDTMSWLPRFKSEAN